MEELLSQIRACRLCEKRLPHGPRPVIQANRESRILIIGQAPGRHVHESGIPWNDPSGVTLRKWLGVDDEDFYDPKKIAHMPMGFCYPGKAKNGDLPPQAQCAETWHDKLESEFDFVRLRLIIGAYAQKRYLVNFRSVTQAVKSWKDYGPELFPLPHPSPLNRRWLKTNPWFESEVLPALRRAVRTALSEP